MHRSLVVLCALSAIRCAGDDGRPGSSCTVTQDGGGRRIVCEDGSSVNIPDATDGASCTLAGSVLTCPDGSTIDLPSDTASQTGDIAGEVALVGETSGVVTVTLTGPSSRTTTTSANGEFSFSSVPVGAYVVQATSPGRGNIVVTNVLVLPGVYRLPTLYLGRGSLVTARRDGALDFVGPGATHAALVVQSPAFDGTFEIWRATVATREVTLVAEGVVGVTQLGDPDYLLFTNRAGAVAELLRLSTGERRTLGSNVSVSLSLAQRTGVPFAVLLREDSAVSTYSATYLDYATLELRLIDTGLTARPAATDDGRFVTYIRTDEVRLWDRTTGTATDVLPPFVASVRSFPGLPAFVYAFNDGSAEILTPPVTGTVLLGSDALDFSLTPQNDLVFTEISGGNRTLRRYDTSTQGVSVIDGDTVGTYISRGNTLLYARNTATNPEVRAFDLAGGTNVLVRDNASTGFELSGDGRYALVIEDGTQTLEICDLTSAGPCLTSAGVVSLVTRSATVAPDGSSLFLQLVTTGTETDFFIPLTGPSVGALLSTGSTSAVAYVGSRLAVVNGSDSGLAVYEPNGDAVVSIATRPGGSCIASSAIYYVDTQNRLRTIGPTGASVIVDGWLTPDQLSCGAHGVVYRSTGGPANTTASVYIAPPP